MYVCMYVCIDACMYVCMHACMHVCMHACMHVCMYLYMMCFICMLDSYRKRNTQGASEEDRKLSQYHHSAVGICLFPFIIMCTCMHPFFLPLSLSLPPPPNLSLSLHGYIICMHNCVYM